MGDHPCRSTVPLDEGYESTTNDDCGSSCLTEERHTGFGSRWAVVGASTLFGAWHLLNFSGSLLGTVLAAAVLGVVSLLWGYAYERTDNLTVPILTHGLYNLTFMLLAYTAL